jgi:predicted Zn-dependent protease
MYRSLFADRREKAAAAARRLRELAPDDPHLQLHAARVLAACGAVEEALDAAEAAVRLAPDLLPAQINRGMVLLDAGRLDEAAALFQELLDRPDSPPLVQCLLAVAEIRRGDLLAGIARYRRHQNAATVDADARCLLAAESALGPCDAPDRPFADELPPEQARQERSLSELVLAVLAAGLRQATAPWRLLLRALAPEAARKAALRAAIAGARERAAGEELCRLIREYLELEPEDWPRRALLAETLYELGRHEEALAAVAELEEHAGELEEHAGELPFYLEVIAARALLRLGRIDDAARRLDAIPEETLDPSVQYTKTLLALRREDPPRALAAARRVVDGIEPAILAHSLTNLEQHAGTPATADDS